MKRFISVFFLLLLINKTVFANTFRENSAFAPLKQQILLKQNESAWHDARSLEAEYLGDVDFDFLYGLAALNVQENERAVYAFERVVANKPNWLDAQYYLASAYYTMKNYHAVLEITQSLALLDNISDKLKASASKLNELAALSLDKQSLYLQQLVDINIGFDSNVNAGTSEDNIFLPLLNQDIILSDNSKETSANYLAFGYQVKTSKALTQSSKLTFSGSTKLHHFINESDYNRFLLRTHVQYKKDFGGGNANVGFTALPLWLDGRYYRAQYGATAGLNKVIDQHWQVASDVFLGKTNNDINRLLSTQDASLQLSIQYITQRWRHMLSLAHSTQTSEFKQSQHNDKKINALNYMLNYVIESNWLASANVSYQHQAYQYEHPFFFEKRLDKMWLLGAAIQYQDANKWSYRLSANIQDKDSNLALFSYQRVDINLSARMSF